MHYLSNRKHFAVRYLLYGYRNNVILYENYISMLKEADTKINTEFIKQDFIRIQENIQFIDRRVKQLSTMERTFIYDVFLSGDTVLYEEIREKYQMNTVYFYQIIRKIIIKLAEMEV